MITIQIKTANAAFEDGIYGDEVARVLAELARLYREGYTIPDGYKVRDINGNAIGRVTLTGRDRR